MPFVMVVKAFKRNFSAAWDIVTDICTEPHFWIGRGLGIDNRGSEDDGFPLETTFLGEIFEGENGPDQDLTGDF